MSIGRSKKYEAHDFGIQAKLEQNINELVKNKAPIEEIQKAYDAFHLHLLEHGIRGEGPHGYMYGKNNNSPISALFLKYVKSKRSALEIGLGDGHFLVSLVRKGLTVYGTDISNVVIARLSDLIKREGLSAEVKLGDAKSLEFPDSCLDYVISKDLVEHITEQDLVVHLCEVRRILKPNGCYILWTPSKLLGHTSLGTHLKEYSLEEVIGKTRSAGLNPYLLNLYCFILFKVSITIPQFLIPVVVKYERIVEKIIRAAKINSQHRLMYIIVPPICVAAYKSARR
jgi:2-polyprenyl-3-methyl-5-hydroxy-6-metoxy-1,4-benzoquinol methylase